MWYFDPDCPSVTQHLWLSTYVYSYLTTCNLPTSCSPLYWLVSISIHSTQYLVRGGLEINGTFEYQIEPKACVKAFEPISQTEQKEEWSGEYPEGSGALHPKGSGSENSITDSQPRITVTYCASVYHSWPDCYVNLYAFYQTSTWVSLWMWCMYIKWYGAYQLNAIKLFDSYKPQQ